MERAEEKALVVPRARETRSPPRAIRAREYNYNGEKKKGGRSGQQQQQARSGNSESAALKIARDQKAEIGRQNRDEAPRRAAPLPFPHRRRS